MTDWDEEWDDNEDIWDEEEEESWDDEADEW